MKTIILLSLLGCLLLAPVQAYTSWTKAEKQCASSHFACSETSARQRRQMGMRSHNAACNVCMASCGHQATCKHTLCRANLNGHDCRKSCRFPRTCGWSSCYPMRRGVGRVEGCATARKRSTAPAGVPRWTSDQESCISAHLTCTFAQKQHPLASRFCGQCVRECATSSGCTAKWCATRKQTCQQRVKVLPKPGKAAPPTAVAIAIPVAAASKPRTVSISMPPTSKIEATAIPQRAPKRNPITIQMDSPTTKPKPSNLPAATTRPSATNRPSTTSQPKTTTQPSATTQPSTTTQPSKPTQPSQDSRNTAPAPKRNRDVNVGAIVGGVIGALGVGGAGAAVIYDLKRNGLMGWIGRLMHGGEIPADIPDNLPWWNRKRNPGQWRPDSDLVDDGSSLGIPDVVEVESEPLSHVSDDVMSMSGDANQNNQWDQLPQREREPRCGILAGRCFASTSAWNPPSVRQSVSFGRPNPLAYAAKRFRKALPHCMKCMVMCRACMGSGVCTKRMQKCDGTLDRLTVPMGSAPQSTKSSDARLPKLPISPKLKLPKWRLRIRETQVCVSKQKTCAKEMDYLKAMVKCNACQTACSSASNCTTQKCKRIHKQCKKHLHERTMEKGRISSCDRNREYCKGKGSVFRILPGWRMRRCEQCQRDCHKCQHERCISSRELCWKYLGKDIIFSK